MLGMKGRKYNLWWSGVGDGVGGVGVMVKEELREKEVEVRRVSDDGCCCLCRGCAHADLCVFHKVEEFRRKNSLFMTS